MNPYCQTVNSCNFHPRNHWQRLQPQTAMQSITLVLFHRGNGQGLCDHLCCPEVYPGWFIQSWGLHFYGKIQVRAWEIRNYNKPSKKQAGTLVWKPFLRFISVWKLGFSLEITGLGVMWVWFHCSSLVTIYQMQLSQKLTSYICSVHNNSMICLFCCQKALPCHKGETLLEG